MSRLVVLGSCGAWPEGGRACSGYLLEHAGFRVVLDLGYGTLPLLLKALGSSAADGLDAVLVTHRHADHMNDLHGLYRARAFGLPDDPGVALLSPPGVLDRVKALEDGDGSGVDRYLRWQPLAAGGLDLGPFQVESRPVAHSVEAFGVRLSGPGLTVAYTGDTGYDPVLAELGRDADVYVVEATDRHQRDPDATRESPTHLTAREAGRVGDEAGSRRLLLTHFWPGNDREQSRTEAGEVYAGPVELATEGLVLELP